MNISRKRIFSVLLIAVLVFTLTACGSDGGSGDSTEGDYKDGTWEAKGEMTEHGYEAVEVTTKAGKIESIDLKRIDADENEVDYDEWDGSGDLPNLKEVREDMAKEMIEKQSADVDTVAGATSSGDNWIKLVKEALDQAK